MLLAFTAVIGVFGLRALDQANRAPRGCSRSPSSRWPSSGPPAPSSTRTGPSPNNHILEVAAADKAALEKKIEANNAIVDKNLTAVEKSLATDAGKRMFAALRGHLKDYREARAGVLVLSGAGKRDEAYALNKRTVVPAATAAAKAFADLFESKVSVASAENDAIEAAAASSRKRSLLLLGAALLIGFGMAFWFSRRIQQTVAQILSRIETLREHCTTDLRNALNAVAQGDLTVDVTPVTPPLHRTSNDEIGDVAEAVGLIRDNTVASVEAYNAMRAQLAGTIAELADGAGTVAAASQQMAATSDETGRAVSEIAAAVTEVAHGAERQVRGLEGAREAVQAAAQAAHTSAEVATATAQAADSTRSVALEGVDAANSASEAMREVAPPRPPSATRSASSPPAPSTSAASWSRSPASPSRPTCWR